MCLSDVVGLEQTDTWNVLSAIDFGLICMKKLSGFLALLTLLAPLANASIAIAAPFSSPSLIEEFSPPEKQALRRHPCSYSEWVKARSIVYPVRPCSLNLEPLNRKLLELALLRVEQIDEPLERSEALLILAQKYHDFELDLELAMLEEVVELNDSIEGPVQRLTLLLQVGHLYDTFTFHDKYKTEANPQTLAVMDKAFDLIQAVPDAKRLKPTGPSRLAKWYAYRGNAFKSRYVMEHVYEGSTPGSFDKLREERLAGVLGDAYVAPAWLREQQEAERNRQLLRKQKQAEREALVTKLNQFEGSLDTSFAFQLLQQERDLLEVEASGFSLALVLPSLIVERAIKEEDFGLAADVLVESKSEVFDPDAEFSFIMTATSTAMHYVQQDELATATSLMSALPDDYPGIQFQQARFKAAVAKHFLSLDRPDLQQGQDFQAQAEAMAEALPDQRGKAWVLWELAETYDISGDRETALRFAEAAIKLEPILNFYTEVWLPNLYKPDAIAILDFEQRVAAFEEALEAGELEKAESLIQSDLPVEDLAEMTAKLAAELSRTERRTEAVTLLIHANAYEDSVAARRRMGDANPIKSIVRDAYIDRLGAIDVAQEAIQHAPMSDNAELDFAPYLSRYDVSLYRESIELEILEALFDEAQALPASDRRKRLLIKLTAKTASMGDLETAISYSQTFSGVEQVEALTKLIDAYAGLEVKPSRSRQALAMEFIETLMGEGAIRQ